MISKILNYIQDLFARREKPDLSFSRVKAYQECPYRYFLRYVQHWHSPPSPYSALGHSIHKALELYHGRGLTAIEDLLQAYDEGWEHEGFNDPQQEMEFYQRGEEILKKYAEREKDNNSTILHVEKDFSINFKFYRLNGIIDRIDRLPDGRIELIDYKTNKQVWRGKQLREDHQLTVYALACRKVLGLKPDLLTYYFLSHGKKLSVVRGRKEEKELCRILKDVGKKISQKRFEHSTKYCFRCDFLGRCSYGKKDN